MTRRYSGTGVHVSRALNYKPLDQSTECRFAVVSLLLYFDWFREASTNTGQLSSILSCQVHGCGYTTALAWPGPVSVCFSLTGFLEGVPGEGCRPALTLTPKQVGGSNMSKQTQQAVETKVEKDNFVLLKSGVMMIGDALLGSKLAAITAEAINLNDDHGLACIVFRNDGFPADKLGPMFGVTIADTYSIAINLDHCWSAARESAEEGKSNLSFLGMLWVNVLSAIGHELDHMDMATKNRAQYEEDRSTKDGNEILEEVAQEAAINMILKLAKKYDIEIPHVGEMGWFGPMIMDLLTNEATKDLEWVNKTRTQMDHSVIYSEGEGKECFSFRDFIKKAHSSEDASWDQPTTCVTLEHHVDNVVVEEFKAEDVVEPELSAIEQLAEANPTLPDVPTTLDLEQTQVEEIMAAANADESPTIVMADGIDENGVATIDMVQAETGQFIGAGTEINEAEAGTFAGAEPDTQYLADPISSNTTDAVEVTQYAADGAVVVEQAVAAVPLPQPVAAQAAAVATAATTAVPAAQPTPTTYTPNTVAQETMKAVMESVWKTLYHHVFTKCGWQQNPQTGRFMFTNAAAVLEGVNIQHIIKQFAADNFIMEYDTLNAEGAYAPEMCQGMIRGRTTSQAGLPSYSLYLNINGQRIKRTFMPQNPEKRTAQNAYTKSAEEAGGGHMIVWVFKDEAADHAPFTEKVAVTIKDNVYEVMGG